MGYDAFTVTRKRNERHTMTTSKNGYLELIKAQSLRVFVRDSVKPTYCFFTDGERIGYAQWGDRVNVSSVHMPNKQSGTGFHVSEAINPESIKAALRTTCPHWSLNDAHTVKKYKSIDDYLSASSWNAALVEV